MAEGEWWWVGRGGVGEELGWWWWWLWEGWAFGLVRWWGAAWESRWRGEGGGVGLARLAPAVLALGVFGTGRSRMVATNWKVVATVAVRGSRSLKFFL